MKILLVPSNVGVLLGGQVRHVVNLRTSVLRNRAKMAAIVSTVLLVSCAIALAQAFREPPVISMKTTVLVIHV